MKPGQATLFEKYPLFRSRDPDEIHAYLDRFGFKFDMKQRENSELDACFNGVYFPRTRLGYYHYGAEISTQSAISDGDCWIFAPIRGSLEMVINKKSIACSPGRALVVSPSRAGLFRPQSGSARMHLCLSQAALDRQLVSLLGRPLREPLEFGPELSLAEGCGRSLGASLRAAIIDLEGEGSILSSSITMNSFEEYVFLALLLRQSHNYSELLHRTTKPIATRDVKRVIDYIQGNLHSSIGLSDLTKISGVAGRTLLKHFSQFVGISPMRYLRMARLDKARERLLGAEPEEGVTKIASAFGYDHMGRFAVEYRRRFGESPSQTLGKRLRS